MFPKRLVWATREVGLIGLTCVLICYVEIDVERDVERDEECYVEPSR
jgi:hypothetical protein